MAEQEFEVPEVVDLEEWQRRHDGTAPAPM